MKEMHLDVLFKIGVIYQAFSKLTENKSVLYTKKCKSK